MHPLRFSVAAESSRILRRREVFDNSKSCQQSHDAFRANTERAKALLVVPGFSFWIGSLWQNSTDRAVVEVLGPNHELEKTQDRIQEIGRRLEGYFARAINNSENDQISAMLAMTANLESLVAKSGSIVRDALERNLDSVIIQVWSGFELLTEQLLLESLDGHHGAFPDPVHIASKKLRFRRLEAIQNAYKTAFDHDQQIDALLDMEVIKALSLLRHLLIHTGGKVDQTFLNQCADLPPVTRFSRWGKGDIIPVDGQMVKELIEPVIDSGFNLIHLVYDWIQAHKQPKK
jgi:hypothetical protein